VGRQSTKGEAAMIDGGTSDFDGGTFCLTGVVILLGVARTATGGGAALLWRNLTASRPLDSITSLAALQKAIKTNRCPMLKIGVSMP
jgi:hypothetical protein